MSENPESKYNYITVAATADLPNGERLFLEIGDEPVVVFNIAGRFFAIGDVCTHDDGPLGDGELDGFEVKCPRHGAKFDVRTGKATRLPAVKDTPSYPVRVVGDDIQIGIPVE